MIRSIQSLLEHSSCFLLKAGSTSCQILPWCQLETCARGIVLYMLPNSSKFQTFRPSVLWALLDGEGSLLQIASIPTSPAVDLPKTGKITKLASKRPPTLEDACAGGLSQLKSQLEGRGTKALGSRSDSRCHGFPSLLQLLPVFEPNSRGVPRGSGAADANSCSA